MSQGVENRGSLISVPWPLREGAGLDGAPKVFRLLAEASGAHVSVSVWGSSLDVVRLVYHKFVRRKLDRTHMSRL